MKERETSLISKTTERLEVKNEKQKNTPEAFERRLGTTYR